MKIKLNRIDELLLKIDLYHLNAAQRLIDLFSPFDPKSAIEAQRLNSELGYHVSQIRPLYDMSQLLIEFAENNLYSPFRGPLDVPMSETTRQMVAGFYDDFFKKARENLNERLTTVKQARANAKRQKQAEREKAKTIASVAVENIQSKKHVVELTGNIVPPEATFHDGDQGDPVVVLPEKTEEEVAHTDALRYLIDLRYNLKSGEAVFEDVDMGKATEAASVLSVKNTMKARPILGKSDLISVIEMAVYHYAFTQFKTFEEVAAGIQYASRYWFSYMDINDAVRLAETITDEVFVRVKIFKKEVDFILSSLNAAMTYNDEIKFRSDHSYSRNEWVCKVSDLNKRFNDFADLVEMPRMPTLIIAVSPRLFWEYTKQLFMKFEIIHNLCGYRK